MDTPDKVSCHLAHDLFIPYLAGEVSPETRAWLEQHLKECESCRAALASLSEPAIDAGRETVNGGRPTYSLSDDAGQRLMRRIRRRTIIVLVLLGIAALALTGFVVWAVMSVRPYSPVPPPASATPAQAAAVDLSHLGLVAAGSEPVANGVRAIWQDASGHPLWVEVRRYGSPDQARGGYEEWRGHFTTQIMATNLNIRGGRVAKFQSSGHHIYACQVDTWFIDIIVPGSVAEPSLLVNRIRDALFVAYANMVPSQ